MNVNIWGSVNLGIAGRLISLLQVIL